MNVCVVGTGYVGLVTGTCFSDFGVNVTCVDKDAEKVARMKAGECPIYEPGLEPMMRRNMDAGRLQFTTDLAAAIKDALVVFIAVGTPPRADGTADLSFVGDVARSVAENLDGYKVVVTKSTVPAGTGAWVRGIIEEHAEGTPTFDVASNPEFLREGSAIEDFMRPNRVVIGVESDQAAAILRDLYRPLFLIETPFVVTNVETSEMIKYASNAFLSVKISYINEIANLCEKVGADVHVVAKGMGLDRRIGPKFLHAGPGYGGSCFPKDTEALTHMARKAGVSCDIVDAAIAVNARQRLHMVEKIEGLWEGGVEGKCIAIAGLAFKPNTDDMREAPAITIIEKLKEKGATVRAYDPEAMENARQEISEITYCSDVYDAARGADALVVMTEWNQFRNLDLDRLKELLNEPVLADLRNVYDRQRVLEKGFRYLCVGR